jgi:hypothetical protein
MRSWITECVAVVRVASGESLARSSKIPCANFEAWVRDSGAATYAIARTRPLVALDEPSGMPC